MRHLDNLYKVKNQGSGNSLRFIMHKVKKEEVHLMVGGLEVESCRKPSRNGKSNRGSKDDSDSKGSSKGSNKDSKGSKGSKGESTTLKPNRTNSKGSKGNKVSKDKSVKLNGINCKSIKKAGTDDLWSSIEAKKMKAANGLTPIPKKKIARLYSQASIVVLLN